MSDIDVERAKFIKDPRTLCKYGEKCYQKNPVHLNKYKHPPKLENNINLIEKPAAKKMKLEENKIREKPKDQNQITQAATSEELLQLKTFIPKDFDTKLFIKQKFLVEMPQDFYDFWDFCKNLNSKNPQEALVNVGLKLVGPYDVLAGNFFNVEEKSDSQYLIHWRYYYDIPEFQTVLKGDNGTGYHIGYFRDSPNELPVFVASNQGMKNGIINVMGENIFAAINIYLEDLKQTGDPFKKMHIGKLLSAIKLEGEKLNLSLEKMTAKMRARQLKIRTRTFNKIGLVVPYDKKTQQGYRELAVSDKDLTALLDKLEKALPEQKSKFLSDLQPVLTWASIAIDECDFGTGIELGWNIMCHGIDSLNSTALRFLSSSYKLLNKEEFAKIAEAHLNNRKKSCNLSIL